MSRSGWLGGVALIGLVVVSSIVLSRVEAASPSRFCPKGSTVVVVGDSITEIAAPLLRVRLREEGYEPIINARGGRTIAQGVEVAWGAGEEISQAGLRCWVFALGTNDSFASFDAWARFIDILSLIGKVPGQAGVREPTVWVPARTPGSDAITALVPTNMGIRFVDGWDPTPVMLQSDGVHPNQLGAAAWVEAVTDALLAE